MREHLHNLQALRGVACLMVVGLHLWALEARFGVQSPILRELQWFGGAGVDLFFVISGFIITSTNRRNLGRPSRVPTYLFRRFWRIYPSYWLALALSVTVGGLSYGAAIYHGFSANDWAAWLTLAPRYTMNAFVGQAWTLTYEVMFYLAFAVLLCLPARVSAGALFAWAAAVVLLCEPKPALPAALLVSPYVLEFLGGCLVAWLSGRGVARFAPIAVVLGVGWAILGISMVRAFAGKHYDLTMEGETLRVFVFGPAAILIVYGFVSLDGRWPRRVPQWLLRIGDASYPLYLLHTVVFGLGLWAGLLVSHSRIPHLLWLVGTFTAAIAVGVGFHRLVERPLLNLVKPKKPSAVPLRAETLKPRLAA